VAQESLWWRGLPDPISNREAMKTSHCLSFNFDHQALLTEYNTLTIEFQKHFNTGFYEGEWSGFALRKPSNALHDLFAGNNQSDNYVDTSLSEKLPETNKVLNFFPCEKTSVRILKLTPGSVIKPHSDEGLNYFDGFVRLHIPIQTNPNIEFIVAGKKLVMKEGECWFADFNQTHSVCNKGENERLHLVIDLKVNDWLKELFLKEGIVEEGEMAPDPMDTYPLEVKKEIVQQLLEHKNPESEKVAMEIMKKYSFEV